MPAIKSSSNKASELVIFATERRGLVNAQKTLAWIESNTDDVDLGGACGVASIAIGEVLGKLPQPRPVVPDPPKQPAK